MKKITVEHKAALAQVEVGDLQDVWCDVVRALNIQVSFTQTIKTQAIELCGSAEVIATDKTVSQIQAKMQKLEQAIQRTRET